MIILLQRHDDITTKKKRRKKKCVSLLDYRESLWSSQLSLLHHSWLNIDNMQSANYKAKIRFLLFDIFYKITPYYTQKGIVVHSIKVADFVISKKIHMKRSKDVFAFSRYYHFGKCASWKHSRKSTRFTLAALSQTGLKTDPRSHM